MKERPIIFTDESVRAILSGRKTQTRRIVKPQFDGEPEKDWLLANGGFEKSTILRLDQWGNEIGSLAVCPYGKPGDRLYVKETFRECDMSGDRPIVSCEPWEFCFQYKADKPVDLPTFRYTRWKSPRFMPRRASRLTLEITGVRVERLQDITEADAQAEGVPSEDEINRIDSDILVTAKKLGLPYEESRVWFARLWNEINGKRTSWESNPFVWVIEFRRLEI